MNHDRRDIPNNWAHMIALALLVAIALVLRFVQPFDDVIRSSDEPGYIGIAQNLAQGRGFSESWAQGAPTAWHAPVTPFILSLFIRAGDSTKTAIQWFKAFQHLLGALSVLLLALAAFIMHGDRVAALLAVALLAINRPLIALSDMVLSETIFVFLLCATLLLILLAEKRRSLPLYAIAGFFAGFGLLTRAALYLFILLVPAILLIRRLRQKRKHQDARPIAAASLFLLAALVVAMPWIVRNTVVFDRFTLVTSNTGFNLYRENADYSFRLDRYRDIDQTALNQMNESQRDRYYLDTAVANIAAHPFRYLGKVLQRLYAMAEVTWIGFALCLFGAVRMSRYGGSNWAMPLAMFAGFVVTYAFVFLNDRLLTTLFPTAFLFMSYGAVEAVGKLRRVLRERS